MADRGELVASCSKWHGDGTTGEGNPTPAWRLRHQLGRWVKPAPVDYLPRWQAPWGCAAARRFYLSGLTLSKLVQVAPVRTVLCR